MSGKTCGKILITGGTGRLGKACRHIFPDAIYPNRQQMDVRNKESVIKFIEENQPDAIVHLAAMAGIPLCENDKPNTWETNVVGTRNIAEAARSCTSVKKLVYLQTACIFPGNDDDEYFEDSLPDPKHYYGMTKLIAEEIVKSFDSEKMRAYVVRTNFTTMPWEYPKAFTDRFGTYLFAQGVAKGIGDVLDSDTDLRVIHLCGDRKISMYEYAVAGGSKVEPMTLADYEGPPLTKNMSLGTKVWRKYELKTGNPND